MSAEELDKQPPQEVKKYLQQSHDRIFESNKKWAEEQKSKDPEFFKNLNAGQSPEYLWIGESNLGSCQDALSIPPSNSGVSHVQEETTRH